jgi:hypothetical protein
LLAGEVAVLDTQAVVVLEDLEQEAFQFLLEITLLLLEQEGVEHMCMEAEEIVVLIAQHFQ